jgi:hypothetical protein
MQALDLENGILTGIGPNRLRPDVYEGNHKQAGCESSLYRTG